MNIQTSELHHRYAMARPKDETFRFRAQIFDTANTYAITYYIMSVEIFGFDIPEYIIAKRYSDFFGT